MVKQFLIDMACIVPAIVLLVLAENHHFESGWVIGTTVALVYRCGEWFGGSK